MYKKDKFGKNFEYRDKLENLEGKTLQFEGEFDKITYESNNCINVIIKNVKSNKNFICNHVKIYASYNKRQKLADLAHKCEKGQKISFLGKVYEYTTKNNSRNNYGLKVMDVL